MTPLFSPPDTPDSIPDSLAPTPVSKLFLSDAFLDVREEWIHAEQEHMISITQVGSFLGTVVVPEEVGNGAV